MKPYILFAIRANNTLPLYSIRKNLFKDESGDVFLLTKNATFYLHTGFKSATIHDAVLQCHIWGKKLYSLMKKNGLFSREIPSDEDFYILRTDLRNLPSILSLRPSFKNRPHIHGTFLECLEKRLGHKISQYNPELDNPQGAK